MKVSVRLAGVVLHNFLGTTLDSHVNSYGESG
jgi:hypothetical protein